MENKKKKSTGLLLSILGVISLVLITAGVTYAFFSYAKQGEKQNTITTGSITFIYNETSKALTISDALPKADSVGISEHSSADKFTFSVTSTTPKTAYINYVVTAKMDDTSTLPADQVKLYLTSELAAGSQDEGTNGSPATGDRTVNASNGQVYTYSQLPDLVNPTTSTVYSDATTIFSGSRTAPSGEKVIYVGQVPAYTTTGNTETNYTRNFKLSMWLKGADAAYCEDNATHNKVTNVTYGDPSVTEPATSENCTTANGYTWHNATSSGIADYSAYEFVKKTAVTGNNPVAISSLTRTGSTTADYNILTSVEYYKLLESQADATDKANFANQYDRIAYVDYTNKTILTRTQAVALTLATSDANGFAYTTGNTETATVSGATMTANEQYYPLNGGTFKVKINVYAEGATTYTVNPGN